MDGRRVARLAALAVLALLLTGCLKLDMDLRIRPDDTVDGGVIFAVDKDLLELTGGSFEDIVGDQTPFPSDVQGVRAEDYEDGKYIGQRYIFEGVPLSEFTDPTDPESLRIVHEGDTFTVSGVLDLSSGATGATGATAAQQFLSSAEIRVAITFPGEVISSNGRVEGNTVIWEPEFGDRLEMQATGSAIESGGGPGSALTIALLVVGVVAVAGILALVTVRRRRPPPAVAGAEGGAVTVEGATPAEPPAEPPTRGEIPPPPPPMP